VIGETLQEVDRVVLAQSEPTRLSGAQVRSTMRDLALGWVFDFTDALEARDLAAAEALIARLLAEGEPPLRLVGLLASHIARLVVVRPFVDQLPRGALRMRGPEFLAGPGASLPEGLRGWPGYYRLRAAANFTLEELRRLHGDVRRLDAALKSSATSPLLLFSRLLQNVCIAASRASGRALSR
jgi:DNA polymerase III delta subunit